VIDVEEAAAEAFATAVERWPADGVPQPRRRLTTTANHKAIDRIPIKTPARSGGRLRRNQIGPIPAGGRQILTSALHCHAGEHVMSW